MATRNRVASPPLLLTQSSLATFAHCPRRYELRYELGLDSTDRPEAMELGSLYHAAHESAARIEQEQRQRSARSRSPLFDGDDENEDPRDEDALVRSVCDSVWTLILDSMPEHPSGSVERAAHLRYQESTRLWLAHRACWGADENLATELPLNRMPVRNPATGRAAHLMHVAGVVDGVVRLGDQRIALLERKTTSRAIEPDSDYWIRLPIDPQLTIYLDALRRSGWEIDTVVYDVARRPISRRPRRVTRDELRRIEHGAPARRCEPWVWYGYELAAGQRAEVEIALGDSSIAISESDEMLAARRTFQPRARGRALSREDLIALRDGVDEPESPPGNWFGEPIHGDMDRDDDGHPIETPEMWGARISAEIARDPNRHFRRVEIARTDGDVRGGMEDVWTTAHAIRAARDAAKRGSASARSVVAGFWRNTRACTSPSRCPYIPICGLRIGVDDEAPAGFVRRAPHGELRDAVQARHHRHDMAAAAAEETTR